jgi:hypothetical protein
LGFKVNTDFRRLRFHKVFNTIAPRVSSPPRMPRYLTRGRIADVSPAFVLETQCVPVPGPGKYSPVVDVDTGLVWAPAYKVFLKRLSPEWDMLVSGVGSRGEGEGGGEDGVVFRLKPEHEETSTGNVVVFGFVVEDGEWVSESSGSDLPSTSVTDIIRRTAAAVQAVTAREILGFATALGMLSSSETTVVAPTQYGAVLRRGAMYYLDKFVHDIRTNVCVSRGTAVGVAAVVLGKAVAYSSGRREVAVIVPYRPHPRQQREKHLQVFLAFMLETFLPLLGVDFRVFVLEQAADGAKFNRGALLNIGAVMAMREGFATLVFHDVDLLPRHHTLRDKYAQGADEAPVHLASMWDKYTYQSYFGGVVAMHAAHLTKMNGFPNNAFGWGGEDDALGRRLAYAGVPAPVKFKPLPGAYEDLEDTYPGLRASTRIADGGDEDMRNMLKREMLEEDPATWQRNGLQNVRWTVARLKCNELPLYHAVVNLS